MRWSVTGLLRRRENDTGPGAVEGPLKTIAPESTEFLVFLFTDLRNDLANQQGSRGPGPEAIDRKRATYDALLSGLADDGELPDDETVREYVLELAKAADEENQYEQTVLEHQAFAELARALGGEGTTKPEAATVDWGGLLVALLHPTQCQIIEAMHWIDQPISASQLVHIFDRSPRDLSTMSYHLRRLFGLKIIKLNHVTRVRGATARFYKLTAPAK